MLSCSQEQMQLSNHFHLKCGAENVSGDQFREGDEYLANANCRSSDHYLSGSYGFKLNKSHQYGPSYKLKSIKKGDIIVLTAFGAGYTWASSIIRW